MEALQLINHIKLGVTQENRATLKYLLIFVTYWDFFLPSRMNKGLEPFRTIVVAMPYVSWLVYWIQICIILLTMDIITKQHVTWQGGTECFQCYLRTQNWESSSKPWALIEILGGQLSDLQSSSLPCTCLKGDALWSKENLFFKLMILLRLEPTPPFPELCNCFVNLQCV